MTVTSEAEALARLSCLPSLAIVEVALFCAWMNELEPEIQALRPEWGVGT